MSHSLRIGKRALTVAIAAATILWSVGFASFVAPLTARAATAGDLVKGTTLSTVYYYANDGYRYAFPNEKTYFTWYSDFSTVKTISDSELANLPLKGNVVYRPGSRWVKIQSDPKTYAVTPNGTVRWVETEAVAQGLAGSAWNTFIDDVPDVFFVDYTVGPSLTSAAAGYNGALVEGSTYLVWNGQKRLVSSSGFSANRFQSRFVLKGTGVNLASLALGPDLTGYEAGLSNTAQTGAGTTTGGLNVSVASDSPASMTIPSLSTSVTVMKFNVSASSGSATISQIDAKMSGLSATTAVSSVYLYEGDKRLTNGRSVNSTTRTVTFGALNMALAAGQTKTLSIVVDMADADVVSGGETFSFELTEVASVASTATVSGSFPVKGAVMSTSETEVGGITIEKSGSITNPALGAEGHVIAEFKLTATSTEAVSVRRLKLDVRSAEDHTNYTLWQNEEKLAVGTQSGDSVTFVLTKPYVLAAGNNRIFKMKADIGGQSADTILVATEESTDVYAVGEKYGFGVAVTRTSYDETGSLCAATSDDCSRSTIQGGKLTFAFNGPTTSKIGLDSQGVTLMRFTITSQNAVDIRDIDFNVAGTTTGYLGGASTGNPNYQNFRLVNAATGATLIGPEEFDNATTMVDDDAADIVSFTDDFSMTAGQTLDVELLVDVQAGSGSYDVADGDTITATLDMSEVTARDANNDDLTIAAGDIVPSADMAGNTMTVDTSSLTVARLEPPSDQTMVKGTQNVDFLGVSFVAGPSSDVKVSAVTFEGYGDADADFTSGSVEDKDLNAANGISSCSIYDGTTGALIDGPESFTGTFASGSGLDVVFTGFNWTIPAGETGKMLARCNLANVAPSSTDDYALEINAIADITAVDEDGDAVSANGGATVNTGQDADADKIAITVSSAGTLAVTLAGDSPASTILLGQSTGVTVAKFKVRAATEDFIVKKLTIENDSTADNPAVGVESIVLEYKNQAGATKTATGFLVNDGTNEQVTFENLTLYAQKNTDSYLTVKVNTGAVTSDNAAQNDVLDLEWSVDEDDDDEFEAVGLSSGTTVDDDALADSTSTGGDNDYFMAANLHEIHKTKPTVSLASGSPSGASVPGLSEVFRFNVSADSRGSVLLNSVTFAVTTSDNTGTPTGWNECDTDLSTASRLHLDEDAWWDIYELSDSSTKLDDSDSWSFLKSTGAACDGTNDVILSFVKHDFVAGSQAAGQDISAGTTKTYVVRVDTTGASSANDDSIRLDIPDEDTMDLLSTPGQAIVWEEDVSTDDNDGDYIKNLPVTGGTIVY